MRFRKVLLWGTKVFSALLVLAIVAFFVLPHFINEGGIKRRIETGLSEKIGAQISYGKADFFFFPHPGVIIHDGKVVFGEGTRGAFDSLSLRMRILPLLTGSLVFSSARLSTPRFTLRTEGQGTGRRYPGLKQMREELRRILKTLAEKAPNLRISLEKGKTELLEGDHAVFSFTGLDGDIVFPPEGLIVRITASSNFAEAMKVLLKLDPRTLSGGGKIDLRQVRLQPLSGYFMSPSSVGVKGTGPALTVSFRTEQMKTFGGEVSSTLSSLSVKRKGKKLEIHGAVLRGGIRIGDRGTEVSLNELKLSDPRLSLEGRLHIDRVAKKASMDMEGSGIDLRTTRKAAHFIAGDVPVIKDIFSYVLDGTVPHVTISSRAANFDDLGNTENIRIRARIENGHVFIRGPRLDCTKVYADCAIVNGMLDATGVSAEVGKVRVRNGKVRIGLEGAVVPLSLDAGVETDMESARGLLLRLVRNKNVIRELSLFSRVRGHASGRVVLSGNSESPDVTADIKEMTFSGDYARIPFPVKITGGGIFYDGRQVATRKLAGSVGSSSFSGLTASLELRKSFLLNIASGSLNVSLPEVYRWLESFGTLRPALRRIGPVQGEVSFSSLKLRGPLFSPKEWRLRAAGSGRDIAFTPSFLPGILRVERTDIGATENKLTVSDARVKMLDSDLDLSGEISGYMGKGRGIDLSLGGSVGPESFRWMSDRLKFPAWVRRSLKFSLSSSRLVLAKDGSTSFSGAIEFPKGPSVSLDLVDDSKGFRLKKAFIEDASSHAEVSLGLDGRRLDLLFSGILTGKTAGTFLALGDHKGGSVTGNFSASAWLGKPLRFDVKGKFTADGFVIPVKDTAPLEVNRLSAEAYGKRIKLQSIDLKWGEDRFSLGGDLISSENGVIMDMDAFSGVIDAASIEKKLGRMKKEEGDVQKSVISSLSLRGTVRIRTPRLTYNRISIEPFSAWIFLDGRGLNAGVTEANFCGISLPGKVNVTHGKISLDFWPTAKDAGVESLISCLSRSFNLDDYATGTFDLSGKITARGGQKDLIPSIRGDINLTARKGRIYYVPSVLKVLAFLDVTELAKGYSDVWKRGLAYDKVTVKSRLRSGRIDIDEGTLDGPYMKMASQGYIDPEKNRLDVKVLVSPMRTIDRIIEKVPVVGWIMGGTLVSIPLRVTGDLEDPRVSLIVLSPDSGLLGMMKRTLELPFKVLMPSALEKKKKRQ